MASASRQESPERIAFLLKAHKTRFIEYRQGTALSVVCTSPRPLHCFVNLSTLLG